MSNRSHAVEQTLPGTLLFNATREEREVMARVGQYLENALALKKEPLDRAFLLQHFLQHYETAVGSLLMWRQVNNWLDEDAVPHWARTGRSS